MRFKFTFQQHANGIETCEAIIDADSKEIAFDKWVNREFTTYLIMKQDVRRELIEDFMPEIVMVEEDPKRA